MLNKLLDARVESAEAARYYYSRATWIGGETADRAREAMDAAWLFLLRVRLLIEQRSVEPQSAEPQARCLHHFNLSFLWATKCMVRERWIYTSLGLRKWKLSVG